MAKKREFGAKRAAAGGRPAPGALDNLIQDSRAILPGWVKLTDVYQVDPAALKDNDLNPELFKEETPEYFQTLEDDIKERGVLVPLIAKKDGVLLAGHNRLVIARRLGLARIPVQYLESELTPDQERALVIKDNLFRRQLTQEDRLRLYKVLIPDFDELIQKETRGAKPKAQGENRKRSGLTAADLTEKAQAAGLPLTLETAEKDLAQARKAGRPKKEPGPEMDGPAQEAARRLKTIKAHCGKIIEALNQADEETTTQGLLQVLELVQTLAGDDSPLVANIEAMRAALE